MENKEMEKLREIEVLVHQKISTNKYNVTNKFKRNEIASGFKIAAMVAVANQKIEPIDEKDYPVIVEYIFRLRGREIDWVNLGAMTKMIEDGLTKKGIFIDDAPKYIKKGIMEPIQVKKKEEEGVTIKIYKLKKK